MLNYPTGMIGLPLRLLAREVYDKVSQKCGKQNVALITGEEELCLKIQDIGFVQLKQCL